MNGLVVDIHTGLPSFNRSPIRRLDGTIGASSAEFIDIYPLARFDKLAYELSFKGPTQNDLKTLSLIVSQFNGVMRDQVFGREGSLKLAISSTIDGSDFKLQVMNNELFDIEYYLTVLTL